jgi:AGZA family xanthine/uracil permease-like MFS transporter
MLVAAIDRQLKLAGIVMLVAAALTLFGIMHSPLPGNQLFVPFGPESWGDVVLDAENRPYVLEFAAGYAAAAVMFFVWATFPNLGSPISDEE